MKKKDIFLFTTRYIETEGAFFSQPNNPENIEKIHVGDASRLNEGGINQYTVNSLTWAKKREILSNLIREEVLHDEQKLNAYLKKIDEREDDDERILETAFLIDEKLKDNLKNDEENELIENLIHLGLYTLDFKDIYTTDDKKPNDLSVRNFLYRVKGINIFAYRTLEIGKPFEILGSEKNFIHSILIDICNVLNINEKQLSEDYKLHLILHEKDIKYPKIEINHLTKDEIRDYLYASNPEINQKVEVSVITFSHTSGIIVDFLSKNSFNDSDKEKPDFEAVVKEIIYKIPFRKEFYEFLEDLAEQFYLEDKITFEDIRNKIKKFIKEYPILDEEKKRIEDTLLSDENPDKGFEYATNQWIKSLDNPIY